MDMYTVKILNAIAQVGLDRLDPAPFTCVKEEENPDAVLVRSADMHATPLNPELLCVARAGAGVNNIPIDTCSAAGVVVFNTPGANANAVREMVLCALFLASRDVEGGIRWARSLAGQGDKVPALVEKGKSQFAGPEIAGKTLGLIGLGAVGVGVANAAHHLGMDVLGFDPYISVGAAWGLSRNVLRARDIKEIYEKSDYISLHAPLTKETRGSLNADAFAAMKDGVRILNFARGELVDEAALMDALAGGKVAAYVTDFPTEKLLNTPKVIPVPPLGATTPESEDNCASMAAAAVRDYLKDGVIRNSVNFPDMELDRARLEDGSAMPRLCVVHKNIPNMLGAISTALAGERINIENMINKSRGEYAYTAADMRVNLEDSGALLTKLREIDGMIRVRMLHT